MTTLLFILGLLVATAALALWSVTVAGVFVGVVLMAGAVLLERASALSGSRQDDA